MAGNDLKPNPEYGAPARHAYGVRMHPDMNAAFAPSVFGIGAVYRLRFPVKIPRALPGGEYRVAVTASQTPLPADWTVLGTVTVLPDRSVSPWFRIAVAALMLAAVFAATWGWKAHPVPPA